ncbi:sugar transporter [Jannaschia sp. W003]|uniref:sugar transporter n=1 Tax=Jannaschia sp. W003 TaxID=2867012 RepID=UPI0021A5FCBF|nr:sugar transporter [Jannaschia sp. W003]UWQ21862.1 sugar transporter [Jannaschia sp. W003]
MATTPLKTATPEGGEAADRPGPKAVEAPAPAPKPATAAKPIAVAKPARTGTVEPRAFRVAPPVRRARLRKRHLALIFSFLLMVALPTALAGYYLQTRAADQFASYAGFSVQREESSSPLELLGGITNIGSGTSDAEILYDFLNSQALVSELEAELGLSRIWSVPQERDPWFAYDPDGSIEDLLEHWERMIQIGFDGGTGLIDVRVLAFRPEDATAIARALLAHSSAMINALSAAAREDAIRYARQDLDEAEERLKTAREAVTRFRVENRIVDPTTDTATQAGVLATLQGQLTEALIERELLGDGAGASDPRMVAANRRIDVIRERIAQERDDTGSEEGGAALAEVVGEFERLSVEREFAESAYVAALAAYDVARGEARRQTRYLATHVEPTTAETARFPQRGLLLLLVAGFAFLAWTILALAGYSLRDRR